jgi:hypothetical protein
MHEAQIIFKVNVTWQEVDIQHFHAMNSKLHTWPYLSNIINVHAC